jgi:thiol-disulfide isomerase/thioredoxin
VDPVSTIDALVLGSRLLLAAVFVAAAVAKLWDREGARNAIAGFGSPERAAAPLAWLLPVAELAVAALLLPTGTALAGALGALALLLLFSVAIALNLARGRAPDCHCFGQLHSAPAGPGTLARNAALAGVAAFAVAGTLGGSDTSAVAWVGDLNGTELAIAAAALVLLAAGFAAFVSLLRSYGRLLLRVEQLERTLAGGGAEPGLELGTPAPMFSVRDSASVEVSLDDLLAPGPPLVLVFASTDCGPCRALLPEVAAWQAEHVGRLTVAVASAGTPEEVTAEAEALGLDHVLVDDGAELFRAFEASGTPSAVLIAPDGAIASRVASGPEAIEEMVRDVVDAPGVPIGAPVPPLELPSLEGERLSLAELRGRDTVLLFWDPECGYCRAMHDELLAWERAANGSTPRLVVLSSGDEYATRSEGFRSKVLLDEDFAAGAEFGVSGTPMAVLLDADGHVASGVAAGAEAVLALAEPASEGAGGPP